MAAKEKLRGRHQCKKPEKEDDMNCSDLKICHEIQTCKL